MTENEVADKYSKEKERLDEKITENRFTYITRRKDQYNEVIDSIVNDNTKLKQCIQHCRNRIDAILSVDDNEAVIEKTMNKLLSSLIKIDEKKPEFGDIIVNPKEAVSPSDFAEQIQEEMKMEEFGHEASLSD